MLKNNRVGIRFSVGSVNNTVSDNVIEGSETSVSTFPGSDTPVEADSGRVSMITFSNNVIMGGGIQIREADKIVFSGNTIDSSVDFLLKDSSALITDDVSVSLSGDSCIDSKSTVDGELCDFEIEEVSDISMNPTQSQTELNLTSTSNPTSSPTNSPTSSPRSFPITDAPTMDAPDMDAPVMDAPVMDAPVASVMNTLSPTDSPTISPVDVEAMEPESVNTDAVSGSSKLSFGLKELTIPIICLFFIK